MHIALLLASASLLSAQAIATTLHVDPDNGTDSITCGPLSDPCRSIQHTIDISSSGDSIYLAPYPTQPLELSSISKNKPLTLGIHPFECLVSPVVFTESEITISHDVTLVGKNQTCTVIDGRSLNRVFKIASGSWGEVKFKNLTIRNGDAGLNDGGGILVESGDMSLQRVTMEDNVASSGGAIALHRPESSATIKRTTLSENVATSNGGAIYCYSCASLTINDSTLSDNQSDLYGGAVSYFDADFTVDNTEFSNNTTLEGSGGAISGLGTITVRRSTFAENHAAANGGAFDIVGPFSMNIMNSTYSNNNADLSGGAFYLRSNGVGSPWASVSNATFIGNSAVQNSGQVFDGSWGQLLIGNSIVELEARPGNRPMCGSQASLGGNNRIGDYSCGDDVTPTANFRLLNLATGIDPVLADNGGDTRTYDVLPGSNVIDTGADLFCTDYSTIPWEELTVDQHGNERKVDGDKDFVEVCDIGAVEY